MPRETEISLRYGTRAGLIVAAAANGLVKGEPFLIDDENRIGVALSASTYETFAKQSEPGGVDGWTYLLLAADQDVSTATWTDLTGLTFTPLIASTYEVEFLLMCRTATATVGARPGFSWSANLAYGSADLYTPSSASAEAIVHAQIPTLAGTAQAAVGGLPVVNVPYAHRGLALFRSGALVQGPFKLQMASETAGTIVKTMAGSFMKYRKLT